MEAKEGEDTLPQPCAEIVSRFERSKTIGKYSPICILCWSMTYNTSLCFFSKIPGATEEGHGCNITNEDEHVSLNQH